MNTRNGSEHVILMNKASSSSIQQRINKTCVSTTNEINNDNATKDHILITKNSNSSTDQYNNEKIEKHQTKDRNDRKKEVHNQIRG